MLALIFHERSCSGQLYSSDHRIGPPQNCLMHMVNSKCTIAVRNLLFPTSCHQNLWYHNSSNGLKKLIVSQFSSRQRECSTAHCVHAPKMLYSGAHPILQSSGLQHWFKNWQELRKHKLTASTFTGAIGFWPGRRVHLWLEKIGAIEAFSGNLATCWSNIKEEEALERYKLITGNNVSFPDFQVNGKSTMTMIGQPLPQMDQLTTLFMVCLLEGPRDQVPFL